MWITSIVPSGPSEVGVRIALIADSYPPLRTSGAVQIRDLAQEFRSQGHDVAVIVPSADLRTSWAVEELDGVQVLRLSTLRIKDIGYVRRTIGEVLLSTLMYRGFRRSPLSAIRWEAIVWYSPTIFLGQLVGFLKRKSGCRSYLILRDVFPEWAVDMGLLKKGLVYSLFKFFERYQYSVADVIGMQSPSNLAYLREWAVQPNKRLEVLQNWLAPASDVGCSISVGNSRLAGRKIFVYAGNMGVAQGMDMVLGLAERMQDREDVGFIFVGRGSDVPRLRAYSDEHCLSNVLFFDEIEPREVSGLLAQCHIGLVMLDPRHKTHNVPGKFVTYMQSGLPVLARINSGNDLGALIAEEEVGRAYVGDSIDEFRAHAEFLCDADLSSLSCRARSLSDRLYSSRSAVQQIVEALRA